MDECRDVCCRSVSRLLDFCRREGWKGYDPYDGLNSPLSRFLPNSRFWRTALTQAMKRCPVNIRPLAGIKKDFNPKGVALAARAIALQAAMTGLKLPLDLTAQALRDEPLQADFSLLMTRLETLKVASNGHACWGYNFDWQSRAFFAPRGTPNAVCTVFAAHAMLDWHEETGSKPALEVAESACRFLLQQLNRTEDGDGFCFSYTPLDKSRVHNVNMLSAELLARLYAVTGDPQLRSAAESAAQYTLSRQNEDGSWPYGEAADQRWIDSFHTGFILVSLRHLISNLGRDDWRDGLRRGYEFYHARFFLADGTPAHYHDRLYPVDVHSAAQAVITFCEMTDLTPNARMLARRQAQWAVANLQDPAGHFYFQRHRSYTIRIPYMRWAQNWMLYALSLYLTRSLERDDV